MFGGSFGINSCFSLGDILVKLPRTWTQILLKQVSVFKRCWSSDVSFESGKSVKQSVGLLWALQLLFIQTELSPPGTAQGGISAGGPE